jgi:hypothetical protein
MHVCTQVQTTIRCLDKCSHNYNLCEYDYLNVTPRAKAAQSHKTEVLQLLRGHHCCPGPHCSTWRCSTVT